MAASLSLTQIISLTGSNQDRTIANKTTVGGTVTEALEQSPILGTTAASLDLGNIAAGSGFFLYMEAMVGNFYVKLGATTGDPVATDSHLYIRAGEGYSIPINPNATAMAGIRVIGDSATSVLRYFLVG
mgnify:CR=1 FL=1